MRTTVELSPEFVLNILPAREKNSHKGIFGSVLNIAGSVNYPGAAYLSSISPLKTGAGYVTLASIDTVINSVAAKTSEVVFFPLRCSDGRISCKNVDNLVKLAQKHTVVCLGCGIGVLPESDENVSQFVINFLEEIENSDIKIVIDADAINAIAKMKYTRLPKNSILTPHPKELARLLNLPLEKVLSEKNKYTELAADKYNAVVIAKGFTTVIADSDCTYISSTGNSALAKAGTGDVLTGMIAGFVAQGASLVEAAALGVYLHGCSGKMAAEKMTQYGVLASEVVNFIPLTMKRLLSNELF